MITHFLVTGGTSRLGTHVDRGLIERERVPDAGGPEVFDVGRAGPPVPALHVPEAARPRGVAAEDAPDPCGLPGRPRGSAGLDPVRQDQMEESFDAGS